MANSIPSITRPIATRGILGMLMLLSTRAGAEPCAVLVEAPSLEVVSSRSVEDEGRADNLLG